MEPENKLIVKLSVRLSGSNKKDYAVSSMYLNQSIGTHHHFNIELRGEELDETITKELKTQLGKSIEIKFIQGDSDKVKFKGIITGINLSNDSDDHKTMTLTGNSDTIRMDDGKNSKCFKDINFKTIIDSFKAKYSNVNFNTKDFDSFSDITLPIFIQYKESNFNTLLRIAELSGRWAYYNEDTFVIGKPPDNKETKNIIIGQTGGHYQIEANLIPSNLEYKTYNYIVDQVYSVKTKAKNKSNELVDTVVAASNELFQSNTVSPSIEYHSTEQDFKNYGETMQNTYISGSVRVSGSSTDPSMGIGDTISLIEKQDGNQKSIGQFIVIQISHNSNVSGYYQNQFEAIPKEVKSPPLNPNIVYPKGEEQTATVIENEDPEKLGRVKVKFIWQDDENDSNWIRVLSPMGGKDHGLYYIPEINDQVLIGFEFDNPNRPYVKGTFYNSRQNTNQLLERFNNLVQSQAEGRVKGGAEQVIKGIFTKEGHHIVLDDNGISLYTKDGKAMVVISTSNDGLVYINTQGKIILSSKEIDIMAIEKLKLSAKSIEVDASDKLELKGGSTAELKGGTEVSVKGGMIKLN